MSLVIVAQLQAKPGQEAELEATLRSLVPATRKESGCERYQLHRSVEDAHHFQLHERWSSRAQWEMHKKAPHLQDFQARFGKLVAELVIFQLEEVA